MSSVGAGSGDEGTVPARVALCSGARRLHESTAPAPSALSSVAQTPPRGWICKKMREEGLDEMSGLPPPPLATLRVNLRLGWVAQDARAGRAAAL